ncbi:MAG TPA: AVAST type 2 anti-phage system protein Avs2 [Mucilaginibacter sp.]|nr:AVAST type 2 anti-phage system protein Avs2 [Mucilaginibacter sp.]
MKPTNDHLLTQLTVRLRRSNTLQTIGSGLLFSAPYLKNQVYLLTAAHCLYADKDHFKQPLDSITLDLYRSSANAYNAIEHHIDHKLVSADSDRDVAILLLDKTTVEAISGKLPDITAIRERQAARQFVAKGFPNATQGKELDVISPTWKQEMSGVKKFQLQLHESYSEWATSGFSGSGVFLADREQVYLFGIFTRFRPEDLGKVIYCQYLETINEILKINFLAEIRFAYFGHHGLTPAFFQSHAASAVKNLGPRFNEALNLRMPVSRLFNVLAKDALFKRRFIKALDKWLSHRDRLNVTPEHPLLTLAEDAYAQLRETVKAWLKAAVWLPGETLHLDKLRDPLYAMDELLTEKRGEFYELRREKQKEEPPKPRSYDYRPPFEVEINRLYQIGSNNDELLRFLENDQITLADEPFLLIKGEAGCGKSHLLGDITTIRTAAGQPTLLLLGQLFRKEHTVWQNILHQLHLTCSKDELLATLNDIGRQTGSRMLILIDALNEGDGKTIWPNELAGLISDIAAYPFIGLVTTVRSIYWNAVVPKNVQTDERISQFTHQGFKGNEYAALKLFCYYYGLKQPNFPMLAPEYASPLFLQLVCEGVKASPGKKFPQGFQGISRLFGYYLQAISDKLGAKRDEYQLRKTLAEQAIQTMAKACFENDSRPLALDAAVTLFDQTFPAHPLLLNDLIQENVFIQSLRKSYNTDTDDEIVYFSYERFGDFFIAGELLNAYNSVEAVLAAFQPGATLGRLLSDDYYLHSGIIEAFAVLLPERFGLEIFEVFAWAFDASDEHLRWRADDWLNHRLLDSLKWRSASSVADDKLRDWFNGKHFKVDFHTFLNDMIELVPVAGHPYNGDRLHAYFMRQTMPERDGYLQQFLLYYRGWDDQQNPYPVRRLIEWAWQPGISAVIDTETARLTGQFLAWLLCATHRQLRDEATKALVNLLEEQPKALVTILQTFKNVDDYYILERLYAVAYGCALRTSADENLALIAQYVYDSCFASGDPPAHLLLRDYARNSVEYALYKKLAIQADPARIRPPYNSPMPPTMPTRADIAKYHMDYNAPEYKDNYGHEYNQVHFSVMEWDFSRYTISSAFLEFSPFSFRVDDAHKKFLKSLKKKQRDIVNLYTTVYEHLEIIKQNEAKGRVYRQLPGKQSLREFNEMMLRNSAELLQDMLGESERSYVLEEIIPQLDRKIKSRDRFRYAFDTEPVKCWIVQRVFELGYSAELHGPFDSRIESYNSRSENKIERIGKKYQWIALYEILAYVADNYQLRDDSGSKDTFEYYDGPWQRYLRDIDPVFTTKNPPKDGEETDEDELEGQPAAQVATEWWEPEPYTYWNQLNADWAVNTQDMPDPRHIIQRRDPAGEDWLYLHLNVYWNEPKPIGEDKYQRLKKDIWYGFQAYLVKSSTKLKIVDWLEGQNFFGRWMPETHTLTGLFNRENYWSPAANYHHGKGVHWQRLDGSRHMVVLATGEAVGEMSDDRSGAHFQYQMPSRLIFEGMGLRYAPNDGDFKNSEGELVVTNVNPRGVLVRKKDMLAFLEENNLDLVWTLLGEKNVWSSRHDRSKVFLKAISGVYALDKAGTLTGSFRILERQ